MKTNYKTILVLAVALMLVLPVMTAAVEKDGQSIWTEDESKLDGKSYKQHQKKIERMMEKLKESDPEKAAELTQLKEKDPEKFRSEFRKVMHDKFGKDFRRGHDGKRWGRDRGGRRDRGDRSKRGGHSGYGMKSRMHERAAEYLEWLEKNNPKEAKLLAKLKKRKPEVYYRKMKLGVRKYRSIIEASKENPELAAVLTDDLGLTQQRDRLLWKIEKTSDSKEKKELTKELKDVVSKRFDVIVKRKQLKYQYLQKKLARLEKKVKNSQAELEKWNDSGLKKENIKARLDELISQTEKFKWD